MAVPLSHALALALALFAIGLLGLLLRRNLLFMLLSLEVMLNAAGLAFVAAGSHWGQVEGQLMFVLVLSLAAAEVAVGLALALLIWCRQHTLDVDSLRSLRAGEAEA